MEYQREFIAKLSNSAAMAVSNTSTIIVCMVFFAGHLFFKHLRHGRHLPALIHHRNKGQTIYCSICLHDVTGGESYRKLPKCHHCFHVDCIDAWLQSNSTCPLCRSQVPHLPQQKQGSFSSNFLSLSLNFLTRTGLDYAVLEILFEDNGRNLTIF
ncbi:unnamed protein product [Ilex paraguariensis]|uniref:RING-type E3 ubiquitin transferase n=1 Tax=Ilex paraguariensis TaxID=185542 RepID=A0ABC8QUV9_9AQUA